MRVVKLFPALLLLLLAAGQSGAWERIDDIVAVVGDKLVLSSELNFQVQMYAVQSGMKLNNAEQVEALRRELLQEMINERLILIKATEDTTIKVSDEEIETAFSQRIEELQGQFPSPEAFDEQLASEGLTLREFKVSLRQQAADQIYKEKLISKLLSRVSVTRTEVEAFFDSYRDSLPAHPRSAKLAHIVLRPSGTEATQDSLRAVAESLVERITAGESFEELARLYSDDPSGSGGGDIGTFDKGDLLPEFERAALALSNGAVSGVVKTQLGFHIIKLVDRKGDSFHCKHILLMNKITGSDSTLVMALAEDLAGRVHAGEDWGTLVQEYSADETTRATFGEIGWFAIKELPAQYSGQISGLAAGEISRPFWSDDDLQIIKVLDRRESRPMSLDEDWDLLKEYARRQKSKSVIDEVVDEMKDKVHLEVRGW